MLRNDYRIRTMPKVDTRSLRARLPTRMIIHLIQFLDNEIQSLCNRLTRKIGFTSQPLRQRVHSRRFVSAHYSPDALRERTCLCQKSLAQRRQIIPQRRPWKGIHLLGPAASLAPSHRLHLQSPIRGHHPQMVPHRRRGHFQRARNLPRGGAAVLGEMGQNFMAGGCHLKRIDPPSRRFEKLNGGPRKKPSGRST